MALIFGLPLVFSFQIEEEWKGGDYEDELITEVACLIEVDLAPVL